MQKIFYITHAKGGSGASLFATNFAYALAKKSPNKKVLFLDANQFSDIANLYGIKAKKDILNLNLFLKERNDETLSKKNIREIFNKTTYQVNELDVLLSPDKYHSPAKLNSIYRRAIQSALQIYNYIIIDAEKTNNTLLQNILPNLQNLFVVTTTDNPSITKTKNFLNNLEKEQALLGKISIIYNQSEKFSTKDLGNILKFPIACVLPTEINAAWDNILLGVPIIENKKLPYSRNIAQLVNKLVPTIN
jgi:MinD-like ATPase involved in chromosome partitioning or flagellar assembly